MHGRIHRLAALTRVTDVARKAIESYVNEKLEEHGYLPE